MNEPCLLLVDGEELVRHSAGPISAGVRISCLGGHQGKRSASDSFPRVRKSSTSCSSISKRSATRDLPSRLGCGRKAGDQGCVRRGRLRPRRAKQAIFVRKSRRYESHMTTNSCWTGSAACWPNGTETEIDQKWSAGRRLAIAPKGPGSTSGRKAAIGTSANEASCPTGKRASRRSFASLLLLFRPTVTLRPNRFSRSQDGGKKPLGEEWWPDP